MREYKVRCSNLRGTYNAGRHVASSAAEACEMAREDYRRSSLGRNLKDVGSFRFFTVEKFDYED